MMFNNDTAFDSNPKLKKVGVKFNLTADEVREYIRCKNDIVYFTEKYVKFITIDKGITNVTLYPFQKTLLQKFDAENRVIVKLARQVGKSSTTAAYVLHYILFNKERTVAILAQKEKVAKELLGRIKIAYENIPLWMQQGIVSWNATSIEIENGCRVLVEATSAGALRAFTISLLILDEFAIVPNHVQEEFFTSVYPTISSGKSAKIIITSTPKGLNMFYRFWEDAHKQYTDPKNWNGFHPFEVHWSAVPGRDKKWADDQLQVLKEVKYNQEVECHFIGSTATLISGSKIRNLVFSNPLISQDSSDIYERPEKNHAYCIVADPSEGKGLDYSTFTVFDITESPYRVVAKYRNNQVESLFYSYTIVQAAKYYNDAYVVVESNDHGALVLHHIIHDIEYDNIFYTMSTEHLEMTVSQEAGAKTPGVRTTKKVKTQGCVTLKTLIENDLILIKDWDMIKELSTFSLQKNKSYAAEPGYNDDLCSNLWLFAWVTLQPFFKDISDLHLRKKLFMQREEKMAELMPAQPKFVSANYDQKPRFGIEQDTTGALWIPAEMSMMDAIEMLAAPRHLAAEKNRRLYEEPFFGVHEEGVESSPYEDSDERKARHLEPTTNPDVYGRRRR